MKAVASVVACLLLSFFTMAQKTFNPSKLNISWEVVENNYDNKSQSLTALTFKSTDKNALPASGWKIYFNSVRYITSVLNGDVKVDHINGDLYVLSPLQNFQPIKPGSSFAVQYISTDWVVNFTDAPIGFFLEWNGDKKGLAMPAVNIIPSTKPKQYLRSPDDKIGLITAEDIFNKNKTISDIDESKLPKIFPTAVSEELQAGEFNLAADVSIVDKANCANEVNYLQSRLRSLLGSELPKSANASGRSIVLNKKEMAKEAYELNITTSTVEINASSPEGFFYAIQSLLVMVNPEAYASAQKSIALPCIKVSDAPRFGYRAFLLDVARNFQPKNEILKILDLMALYKLNTFHLHFSDDEGWRIQMPSLPELTEVGARRGWGDELQMLQPSYGSGADVNNKTGTGFYTTADFIEILKYATERHIQVIPEIETPGHGRAAIKSMYARYVKFKQQGNMGEAEKYLLNDLNDSSVYSSAQMWQDNVMNVAMPSVYTFVERVVDDLRDMYKTANAPLTTIHMGGDEVPAGVWEKSPVCQALMQKEPTVKNVDDLWYYYYDKVNKIIKSRNLFVSGWEEIGVRKTMLDGEKKIIPNPQFGNEHFQPDVWNNVLGWGAEDLAYKQANAGYNVVLSCVSNFYFDMAYYKAFDEPGYYWGGFLDVDKPFYFIPYDYFKNAKEDNMGNPLDRSIFNGKERLTDYGKSNIVGVKGLVWSENNISSERMEYMMLPKFLGLVERAWAKDPEWANEKDSAKAESSYQQAWSKFVNVVGRRELSRLDNLSGGFNYRIPTPGLNNVNGAVNANIQLPGLQLRYTTDGSEPTIKSSLYTSPVSQKGTFKFKAFNSKGRSGKTATLENK